ncbi:Flagellar motor switch protein FliN [wastewater metagenome]|uniref:Flagellar motor switch protein FliN n=2 Tax=unclassified sequences TaxID=12908 RepID=A0A5B8R711_9ZZZZ|nr:MULTISPECIES: flagellar motor switch protein FliN [Arhodomonas]MCS4502789.1 flagellar motor switch protein FliN [Arhodomonas aquaeolei]QEA03728.1 flagellar motor switch protein FliN [uncultured organism]
MSDEDNQQDDQGQLGDEWEAALAEQGVQDGDADDEGGTAGGGAGETGDDAGDAPGGQSAADEAFQRAALNDLQDSAGAKPADEDVNLDVILDIPVTLSMEIGRTKISIRNLLQLNQGSVVELDRLAGEPMDVMVNGTLVAHGEVVVVNERFGIRLTDVVSPSERVRKLK